ncbi:MAG: site-specific DNA-methyltransferase [Selenomonadaceae bacterium]|nr:site-specific DNA-methyltransferase [Selenomonadaceae bacterium]
MLELKWDAKDEALRISKATRTRLLEFNKNLSFGEKNSGNTIVQGDNLQVLKSLLPFYRGQVKCIYIDPPYNTGAAFENYNDNFPHSDWLSMMYPRLELLREFLSEDGAIFISIDDTEQAYLKVICDEIFDRKNFVANFSWRKRTAKSDVPHGISQDCENILCYANEKFLGQVKGKERKYYSTEDFLNRAWRFHDLTTQRTATERPNSFFTIVNPKNGKKYPANPLRTWAITEETFQDYFKANRIIFPGDYDFLKIKKPVLRYWKDDDMRKAGENFGMVAASTFLPAEIGMSQDGTKEITEIFGEKKFSFPKPSSLIQHLIGIATNTDKIAIILDAFAGSGTTAHAVLKLNESDGGNRKFILIEEKEYCKTITAERVKRVGGSFDFYRLGAEITDAEGKINSSVTFAQLANFVWFSATKTPYLEQKNSPLLGICKGTAIYLLYNGILKDKSVKGGNILTKKILSSLPQHDGEKIIYGSACRLDENFLEENRITFRQIPKELKL